MKKNIKNFGIAIMSIAVLGLTSCSSGWSCQKKYVDNSKIITSKKQFVKPC
jgi:hypothetical protein